MWTSTDGRRWWRQHKTKLSEDKCLCMTKILGRLCKRMQALGSPLESTHKIEQTGSKGSWTSLMTWRQDMMMMMMMTTTTIGNMRRLALVVTQTKLFYVDPAQYYTGHVTQLPSLTQPGHPSIGKCSETSESSREKSFNSRFSLVSL